MGHVWVVILEHLRCEVACYLRLSRILAITMK
jgi:hypothetical protein